MVPARVLLLLALFPRCSSAHGGCDDSDAFDYLLLVQQWDPYFRLPAEQWTLHGLWPSRGGGNASSYPCGCTKDKFDDKVVSDLIPQMDKEWPSNHPNADEGFWKHEFEKHGTCAIKGGVCIDQHDFFSKTLKLYEAHNLANVLSHASIVPGSSYAEDKISAAFKASVGAIPMYGCQGDKLKEIAFCFDKSFKVIDCDEGTRKQRGEFNNCEGTQLFLTKGQAAVVV